jgi:hypothetical protein
MLVEVNYLAVLVATVASFVIGWAWYSPVLFVKPWMKLRGQDFEAARANGMQMPWGIMAVEFISTLVVAFFIAEFAAWVGATGAVGGLVLGFWIWLGFYATTMLGAVLWEKAPLMLYVINAGRWLVSLLAMAAILGAWR